LLTFVLKVPLEFLSGNPLLLFDLLTHSVCHVLHAPCYLGGTCVPLGLTTGILCLILQPLLLGQANVFLLLLDLQQLSSLFLLSLRLQDAGSLLPLPALLLLLLLIFYLLSHLSEVLSLLDHLALELVLLVLELVGFEFLHLLLLLHQPGLVGGLLLLLSLDLHVASG
jgi:hypothetical protein